MLELRGTEHGQDLAEMVVRWRAVFERSEAAQRMEPSDLHAFHCGMAGS